MAARLAVLAVLAVLAAASGPCDVHEFRCAPEAPPARCKCESSIDNEIQFQIEGKTEIIIKTPNSSSINVLCKGDSVLHDKGVLESLALPKAETKRYPTDIVMRGCRPPAAGALRRVLARLNVSEAGLASLELRDLPPNSTLNANLLEGLADLHILTVLSPDAVVRAERDLFVPLKKLEKLELQNVSLLSEDLDILPMTLRTLTLAHTGVERLPKSFSLRELDSLYVASASALAADAVPSQQARLGLSPAGGALVGRVLAAGALRDLTLARWPEEKPEPLNGCASLTSFVINSPAFVELPLGWLNNCSSLERLELIDAENLTRLPDSVFSNPTNLTYLSFNGCALETFPVTLLLHAPYLRVLKLYDNRLKTLPRDMFVGARGVQHLDLTANRLEGELGASSALAALAALRELRFLALAQNPRLRHLCSWRENSPFSNSKKLQVLELQDTGVEGVCRDWREDMLLLEHLNLQNTSITKLFYTDVDFKSANVNVFLENTPLTVLGMDNKEYISAISAQNKGKNNEIHLPLNSRFKCDCHMYWTRRALDLDNKPLKHFVQIANLKCDNVSLGDIAPEDMLCADDDFNHICRDSKVPDACACGWRDDDKPDSNAIRVRIDCARRGLRRAPAPAAQADVRYELRLQHNRISDLPPAVLRPDIVKINLTDNSVNTINNETLKPLSNFHGELQLAHNNFNCSCDSAPLLRAIDRRLVNLSHLVGVTCSDRSTGLVEAAERCRARAAAPSSAATWLAAALAALLALAVLVVAFLASRERRLFAKAVLYRWGLWRPGAERADAEDGRPYDAFVTFSHKDEARVLELVARLEPAYRLCVHYRDWVPGRTIAEQIAESVADSRRTIALVSRHFLDSGWALAEFRQAHAAAMLDARPRLVVVLLEEPAALRLDAQLRRYLATNTYVRWSDPWLWDKLALALPRPRPRPPAAPQAADPMPAAPDDTAAAAPRPASTQNSPLSKSVISPAATSAAVRRSPADTQLTPVADRIVSSSETSDLSASAVELELAPLCPPAARDRPPPARDRPPPARDRPPPARDRPPAARDRPPTRLTVAAVT